MQTLIPADWAAVGHGIPSVCSRHGLAATLRARTRFESAPPGWTYALIPLGLLAFIIVRAVTRHVVDAPVWHYCDRCRSRRRTQQVWFGLLTAAGVAGLVAAFASNTHGPVATLLAGAGLTALIVGYIGLVRARWEVIAQAHVTRDGQWIAVSDPAPEFDAEFAAEFAAAMATATTAARQRYAPATTAQPAGTAPPGSAGWSSPR